MSEQKLWNDKRYYSLNYYLKETFGEKVYKLSLNGGMSCPNRDGTLGNRGCIFCSEGGSGDFSSSSNLSITKQIEEAKLLLKNKATGQKYIAYFQAFSNTYANINYLKTIFYEAILHPDIVALSIATRPDCIHDETLELLSALNNIKPVWVELGLQTTKNETADYIRRGFSLDCFTNVVNQLNLLNIDVITHVILGLPYETESDMLDTISYLSQLPIQGVKLQLLHVLKNTDLAQHLDDIHILSLDEYIDILIKCIERLPNHMVIHRVTGDGPKNLLLAPLWSSDKKRVLNRIHHSFLERNTWQGRCYVKLNTGG